MGYDPSDKFSADPETMRVVTDPATICNQCKHYLVRSKPTCKAFPGGIPDIFNSGEEKHLEPYEGDNGLQFEHWRS